MRARSREAATAWNPAAWFVLADVLVSVVNDGWSGRPSPLLHQLYLIPLLVAFTYVLVKALRQDNSLPFAQSGRSVNFCLGVCVGFESVALLSFRYEEHHFARFGYSVPAWAWLLLGVWCCFLCAVCLLRCVPFTWLLAFLGSYAGGLLLALRCFPLNYLRSDMLPVIVWADERLLQHLNPYGTMHVGARVYDFPYLPGMMLAYLPAVAMHFDVRYVSLFCMTAIGVLLYAPSLQARRREAAGLIGVLLLSPFLQYRHELYLEPHWLMLVAAVVLLQQDWFRSAFVCFGFSMALYQLSWVMLPFLVLFAYRSRGWRKAVEATALSLGSMLLVMAPFLRSATSRIAHNTVGQWSRMPHALADPLNVSYWLTFLVRPDQLKWLQLAAMTCIFAYCVLQRRCETLTDTLRWMTVALGLFIAMNVLVDGYFYLTLMLMLLMYTLAALKVWPEPVLLGEKRLPEDNGRMVQKPATQAMGLPLGS